MPKRLKTVLLTQRIVTTLLVTAATALWANPLQAQDRPKTDVVFLDNDVLVTAQWLARLVECAEETQADYVSPVVRQHVNGTLTVHIAGGASGIQQDANFPRIDAMQLHL